jgi:triosephosphate isomerase
VELARGLKEKISRPAAEVAVCPPFVYIDAVREALAGSSIAWGGQDVYHEPNGAFTGEVSAAMLVDLGCRFAILGHSERRRILGENDEEVCRKTTAALAAGLAPIVCVGETLAEREKNQTWDIVASQLFGSLAGLSAAQMAKVVIAYEPVWAIGTGKTATPQQAQEVHADLRKLLANRYNSQVAESTRILYGGSVKPDNAAQLMQQPDIDGALVGGASLDAEGFSRIVAAAGA